MKFNIQFTIGDDVPVATKAELRNQQSGDMLQSLAPVLMSELLQIMRRLKIIDRDKESASPER